MFLQSSALRSWLGRTHSTVFILWCSTAAFVTYFSMYAFRKPFTVAKYEGLVDWGVGYKIILLFSQVGGYALSKFIGIKVISEMSPHRRALAIVGLIAVAHLALLPFAVAPFWLKPVFLFCNGLPLGMVFGCVLAFLEGRRLTEALVAGLCASFIMASGVVKSVGAILMENHGVSLFWMPFATGALFWPALLLGVWMLEQIPPPSESDVDIRSERTPMTGDDRRSFYSRYGIGLTLLIVLYVLLTLFRSVRDDYATEIWADFGIEKPDIFARSETLVAAVVLLASAAAVFVKGNYRAFLLGMALIGGCFVLGLATTVYFWGTTQWTQERAFAFMVIVGISLYVPYVLFHTTIFERVVALLRDKSNIGFLMYLGDCAGYVATVALMVVVDLGFRGRVSFADLLFWLAVVISPVAIVGTVGIVWYFRREQPSARTDHVVAENPQGLA